MTTQVSLNTSVEMFPIRLEIMPKLTAYRLSTSGGVIAAMGGKLSYRLKRTFPGHWTWTRGRVLTDSPQDISQMMSVVEDLWKEQPETFGTLIDIRLDERWRESTQSQAEFVANGLIPDMDGEIRSYLSTQRVTLRNAKVDRVYRPEVGLSTVDQRCRSRYIPN